MSHPNLHNTQSDLKKTTEPTPQTHKSTPLKRSYKKLSRNILILVSIVFLGIYSLAFHQLNQTEKFLYIDQLSKDPIAKTATKISMTHEFLWKQKGIIHGAPFKAQAIKNFSSQVKQNQKNTQLETTLLNFWNKTKQLHGSELIFPEKIIFSFTNHQPIQQAYQRMIFWTLDGQKFSTEINQVYGQVITEETLENESIPSGLDTIPAEKIIKNLSNLSLKLPDLAYIMIEYQNNTKTYDITLIDTHQVQQDFYINERGFILRKEN